MSDRSAASVPAPSSAVSHLPVAPPARFAAPASSPRLSHRPSPLLLRSASRQTSSVAASLLSRRIVVAVVAGLGALVAFSSTAEAQQADQYYRWKRHDRPMYESPQHFALELRFGPYRPNIDDDFPGTRPFESVFGNGKGFHYGLEVDWQAFRIPYLGTLGPGLSWARTTRSANAKLTGSTDSSAESTTLAIMPMSLVAVLRADVLARNFSIPLVPYVKAGLGFGLWSTGTDQGTSKRDGVSGKGRTWGTHAAIGGMFLLDFFDRASAREIDDAIGVNHSYVFLEYMRANLDGSILETSKPQLNIGTTTWVIGLAMEM
jgi:hypothetical protein